MGCKGETEYGEEKNKKIKKKNMEKNGRLRIPTLDFETTVNQMTLPAPEITQRSDSLILA